ncbi:MAG: sensor histidine kinase [Nocardioides sp.]
MTSHGHSDPTIETAAGRPDPSAETKSNRTVGTNERHLNRLAQLGRDTAYLVTGLPLAVASFTVLLTGFCFGIGTLITVIGLPALVITLSCARLLAAIERQRVAQVGPALPAATYLGADPAHGLLRRWFRQLRDTQAWLDLAHGLLVLPLAIVTFTVAVTWWSVAVGGLTYWLWGRYLPNPESNVTLSELLRLPVGDSVTYALLGVAGAMTLTPVLRVCALAHTGFASALLGNHHVAQLQDRVARLTASRTAAGNAEIDALRRLERDLHDGPQQRLVRLGMDLASVERRLAGDDPRAASEQLREARALTADALAELRALSRGIAPPILTDRGLNAALLAVVGRSPVPARLDYPMSPAGRLPAPIETAAYFLVSEAMANVAKHSGATETAVGVRRTPDAVTVEVTDNGRGGAALAKGHGLAGLRDRLAAIDGTLEVISPAGGPTTVTGVFPCGS